MAVNVQTVVARVRVDASQFQQQMSTLEQQSKSAIAQSASAMSRLAAMQLQAEATALTSAKTTAQILSNAMNMMTSDAHSLKSALYNVQAAAQTALSSIQHQRYLLQHDLAQISTAKAQVEAEYARQTLPSNQKLFRWQGLQVRNQSRMSDLAAEKAAVERAAVQDELRQFSFIGTNANLPEHLRNLQRDKLNVGFSAAQNDRSLFRRNTRRLDEQLRSELELADVSRQRASVALTAFNMTNPGPLTGDAALQQRELQARATLADIIHGRMQATIPNKEAAARLQDDAKALKMREIDLKRTQTQIDQDASRKLEPLQYRETLLKERMANNKAAQDRIKADMSIPTQQRATQLADLSVQQKNLEHGMAQVTSEMTGVKATASKKMQELGIAIKENQAGQAKTKSMADANKSNLPSPFQWDWKGAMFGGMYGSVVGGRMGSLVGAGVGGLFGLPMGIAAATAMVPLHLFGKFLSTEFGLAEHAAMKFLHVAEHLGSKALHLAMEWERVGTSFQVFTGSAEEGVKLLEGLRDVAIKTPFKLGQLLGPAEMMLGMGVGKEDVLPSISRLGDVAGGNPLRLQRLSLAYSQVRAHGRFQGQELRQFAEAGVGAEDFAKTIGVSTREFRDLMKEGLIPASVMVDTINRLTDAGGRFFEMNKKQLKTVSGSWNSLEETIDVVLQKLGTGFLQGSNATGNINYFKNMFEGMIPGSNLEQKGKYLGQKAEPLLDVGMALGQQIPSLIDPFLKHLFASNSAFEDNLVLVGMKLADFANWLGKANMHIVLFTHMIAKFVYTASRVGTAIGTLGGSEISQLWNDQSGYDDVLEKIIGKDMLESIKHPDKTVWADMLHEMQGRNAGFEFADDYYKAKEKRKAGIARQGELEEMWKKPEVVQKFLRDGLQNLLMLPTPPALRAGLLAYHAGLGGPIGLAGLSNDLIGAGAKIKGPRMPLSEVENMKKGLLANVSPLAETQAKFDNIKKKYDLMARNVDDDFIMGALRKTQKVEEAQTYLELEKAVKAMIPQDWRADAASQGSVEAQDAINMAQQEDRNIQVDIKNILDIANEIHKENQKNLERAKDALEGIRKDGAIKIIQRGI